MKKRTSAIDKASVSLGKYLDSHLNGKVRRLIAVASAEAKTRPGKGKPWKHDKANSRLVVYLKDMKSINATRKLLGETVLGKQKDFTWEGYTVLLRHHRDIVPALTV